MLASIQTELNKKSTKNIVFSILMAFLFVAQPNRCAAQYDAEYVSYNDFYQRLAPYGQWLEDPEYGYVWSPSEDINFRPYYTNGHWTMTEYGNTWVSEYVWGWACFHYGRWTYDAYYGWLWIPGSKWGPAWVSWRYGDGFYGWSPLSGEYGATTTIADYNCPIDWWVFVPARYLYSGRYYRFWYGAKDNKTTIKTTGIVTNTFTNGNTTYITGPQAAQIKQVTGKPVQVFKVRNSKNPNTRIHDDIVRMYRPAEVHEEPRPGEVRSSPPDIMTVPRAIGKPQRISTNGNTPFRETIIERNNSQLNTPGTNINQTAVPQTPTQTNNNPYEWDVSRSVKQEYTPPPKPPVKPKQEEKKPANGKHPVRKQPNKVIERKHPHNPTNEDKERVEASDKK